jgi:hypothetical protein
MSFAKIKGKLSSRIGRPVHFGPPEGRPSEQRYAYASLTRSHAAARPSQPRRRVACILRGASGGTAPLVPCPAWLSGGDPC